ncbi:MAG TPA: VOC family protein [Solirubrobacteraceae bacterium]|jgi:catechol 2,3-dioxygenase-like lactoylglutathione lyase family enzyme|nr:VOC family protein [Solirubrobacteraceae bacterium]
MSDPLERLLMPIVPVEPRPEFAAALLRQIEGADSPPARDTATVRYFVDDLDAAVAFYRELLAFEEELRPSPAFAMLYRGDLRLLLSVPGEPHVLPDGTLPRPGGHNRISLRTDDLSAAVAALRQRGARFRTEIVTSVGVDTVLLEDPAGNPVELFEPRAGYHERMSARLEHQHPDDASTPTEEETK